MNIFLGVFIDSPHNFCKERTNKIAFLFRVISFRDVFI